MGTDEQTDRWADIKIGGWVDGKTDIRADRWDCGRPDRRADKKDGSTNRWTDLWVEKGTEVHQERSTDVRLSVCPNRWMKREMTRPMGGKTEKWVDRD